MASLGLILATAFFWSIVEWVTVLLAPGVLLCAWLFFLVAGVVSLVTFCRRRRQSRSAIYALLLWVIALAIVLFVPFTKLTLDMDYHLHKANREAVIARLAEGSLRAEPGSERAYGSAVISLGRDMPTQSRGGNEIIVQKHQGGGYFVLFFTFRGVVDNYSGFLYVPDGADPKDFLDLRQPRVLVNLVEYSENWYWVSCT